MNNCNDNNIRLCLFLIIIIAFVLWIIILNQSITIKFLNAVVSQINVIIKKINNFVSIIELLSFDNLLFKIEIKMNQLWPDKIIQIQETQIQYSIIKKEKEEYVILEQFAIGENCQMKWFREPKDIPNILKGKGVENRQLVVFNKTIYGSLGLHTIVTNNQELVEINTTTEPLEIIINLERDDKRIVIPIFLEPYHTTRWKIPNNRINKVVLRSISKRQSVFSIEIFENEDVCWSKIPRKFKEDLLSIPKEIFENNKSFLRKSMSIHEINKRICFLSVTTGLPMFSNRPMPLSVIITNYQGIILYETIITPRGKVRDYRSNVHGMTEKQIISQTDEAMNRVNVNEILEGTIVVGWKVRDQLQSLRVTLRGLHGIRDLSNGLIFYRGAVKRTEGRFTLANLSLHYLDTQIALNDGKFSMRGDVIAIRQVYIEKESSWVDHLRLDGSFEPYKDPQIKTIKISYVGKSKITDTTVIDEIDIGTKGIYSRIIIQKENELCKRQQNVMGLDHILPLELEGIDKIETDNQDNCLREVVKVPEWVDQSYSLNGNQLEECEKAWSKNIEI